MLLDQPGLETRSRGHGSDLAGMIALHATNAHEGIAAFGKRVGEQVL
jgi:hypothetical protein